MVDQLPFLLEALVQVQNNTFIFQQHLKVTCHLLPPLACACFLLFEQLSRQQMFQLKNSISECLHHHTLFNTFSDKISEAHHVCILSCCSPKLRLQFNQFSQPFNYFPWFFAQYFVHNLDYPIILLQVFLNMCAHIPSTLWLSTSYVVFMATNSWKHMMQFATHLLPLLPCWFPCGMKTTICVSFNRIQFLSLMS